MYLSQYDELSDYIQRKLFSSENRTLDIFDYFPLALRVIFSKHLEMYNFNLILYSNIKLYLPEPDIFFKDFLSERGNFFCHSLCL